MAGAEEGIMVKWRGSGAWLRSYTTIIREKNKTLMCFTAFPCLPDNACSTINASHTATAAPNPVTQSRLRVLREICIHDKNSSHT